VGSDEEISGEQPAIDETSPSKEVPDEVQHAPSPWDEKVALAHSLWEAGNNVRLAEVISELEKAPEDEREAHATAQEMSKRLKPDPIAIALWAMTFGVFLLLIYLFIL
jgi:hypothetical protein